jgi:hypothetical protein
VDASVITWTLPLTALIAGFLGSLHCLGMCGGISGTIALSANARRSGGNAESNINERAHAIIPVIVSHSAGQSIASSALPISASSHENVIAFNLGRILSYGVAGALAGSLGGLLGPGWIINDTASVRWFLFVIANLMIILSGLYLMGITRLLAPLERAGGSLWKHVSPLSKKLMPISSPGKAAIFGAVWGWIPCGLVYAMLITAISAGNGIGGFVTMFAFGVGTLPAMLAAGFAAGALKKWTRETRVRMVAGALVVAMGLFGMARIGTLEQLNGFGAFCIPGLQSQSQAFSVKA